MAKKSMKALITFSDQKFDLFTVFFVEEQRSNGRWRRIPDNAGPHSSSTTASNIARRYAQENHVRTRVVGEM